MTGFSTDAERRTPLACSRAREGGGARFFEKLSADQKASVLAVGIDRSGGYRAAVEQYLPTADIVFDKLHLVANLGQVIDKIRRRTQAQADSQTPSAITAKMIKRPKRGAPSGGGRSFPGHSPGGLCSVDPQREDSLRSMRRITWRNTCGTGVAEGKILSALGGSLG
jgi:hypothetical protein